MREIVNLQVGQCGNQVGSMFWEKICIEHKINADGECIADDVKTEESRLGVYFSYTSESRCIPRSIMVDLETGTSETIKDGIHGNLFKPDNFVNAQNGAGNNFAKGFYTEGAEIIDKVLERVRKEVEDCESIQGFQILHSCGGGTGSGMGSRILSALRDDYSERIISTFTVFPSPKVSDVVVEPYNATLTLNHLIESASNTFCLDNDALYNICVNTLKIASPAYADINSIVSDAICGITSCVRFPGQLNSDLRKLSVNLTPFPRLHFFLSSIAPLSSEKSHSYRSLTAQDIINQLFDSRNMMAVCDPSAGKYFAVANIFRGNVSSKEVEDQLVSYHKKNERNFVPWIPNNVLTASTDIPMTNSPVSGTFIGNTTAITCLHEKVLETCNKMLERKAFLYWYTDEGMEEEELTEAIHSVMGVINDYKAKEEIDLN